MNVPPSSNDSANEPNVMADEMVLHDVETIKVFADERRLQILEQMRRPTTVKAVAQALGESPSRLYYHVNLLHEHGLIRVVDHNIESGIVEKVYQASARQYRLVNPLVAGTDFPPEAAAPILASLLDDTRREFLQALASRDPAEGTPPRHPFLSKKTFRLTNTQLTALHARLDALIKEVTSLGEANDDGDEPAYSLAVVFYRHSEES